MIKQQEGKQSKMSVIYSETETYDIILTLGKGTFGEVAKCWKRSNGEMVAVKILKSDAYRSRIIKNELKLLAAISKVSLDDCHIVTFYEAFHDESQHYLVFELMEKNLFDLQKENGFSPLPVRHIRTIVFQVLKALVKLKELTIIHADLKPENIMIVDHCRFPFRVKVIDFGSASIFNEVRYVKEPYIQSRFYRSPEILLGLPFCEKVDMWSLGCVMAELYLGWPLYPGDNELEQVSFICKTQGMPKTHLLNAASKTHQFFKWTKTSSGTHRWQLKSSSEDLPQGKGVQGKVHQERRKYVLSSLDELETVNAPKAAAFQGDEALAAISDRKSMVELLKRMLTLDSHERINPSSALQHPFVTMQHLKITLFHSRYCELSMLGFQEALSYPISQVGDEKPCYRMSEDQNSRDGRYQNDSVRQIPVVANVQRTTDKMGGLRIDETELVAAMNLWGEGGPGGCFQPSTSMESISDHQELPRHHHQRNSNGTRRQPVLAYHNSHYGAKKQASRHSKSDPTFRKLILLGQETAEGGCPCTNQEDSDSPSSKNPSSIPEFVDKQEEKSVKKPPQEYATTEHGAQYSLFKPEESDSSYSNGWSTSGDWSPGTVAGVNHMKYEAPPRNSSHHDYLHLWSHK
ncbi:homeodomain-interacting protein kinase 4-like [Acipenser oxyrinchus oxyrinchus]|uniref:non-specific serine/threonine protein kinase n=1 Tax=Acipenser oxyrinchus oxyrinchus TaxID=40147 RepID=A0AAD8CIN7_ACIOX|nr:homeodomain-interacting protein kinase 4-like [Acipenser oxyrinchus oxyrinchus]